MVATSSISIGVGAVCAAAIVVKVLFPPLQRRTKSKALSAIPLRVYLSFELRAKIQSLLLAATGVSKQLESLPEIDIVAPNIIRILGKNPGRLTLQGTNTYLVGEGATRVLIDTGGGNALYLTNLLRVCKAYDVHEITDILLTHAHLDHIGGILHIKSVFPNVRIWKYLPPNLQDKKLRVTNRECEQLGVMHLPDGKEFKLSNTMTLRALYTPGHCVDHMTFLLEEKNRSGFLTTKTHNSLFSGDCILGFGSCVFESLRELMASLHMLKTTKPQVIYPGHGPVVKDVMTKINEYIAHREDREREIIDVLAAHKDRFLSSSEIVSIIYTDIPMTLRFAARRAVDKHLEKLCAEKRVVAAERSSWLGSTTLSFHLN